MSHIPEIMKTIAKRILDQSSTQRDLEDKNSNDDPVVSDNEHSKNPEQCQSDPAKQELVAQQHSLQKVDSSPLHDNDMQKAMLFFVGIQKRRLQCIYPNFKSADIETAAIQSWSDLQPEEKEFYLSKAKLNDQEQVEQLELWAKMNEQALRNKKSAKFDLEDGQIVESDQDTQTKHQKPVPQAEANKENINNEQPEQVLSSLEEGEVAMSRQLSNNDQTNTSSVAGDQANIHINANVHVHGNVLPVAQTLAQTERSDVIDSEAIQVKPIPNPSSQDLPLNQESIPKNQNHENHAITVQVTVINTQVVANDTNINSQGPQRQQCSKPQENKDSQRKQKLQNSQ